MSFEFKDKPEYKDILLFHITDNKNGLPFFVKKMDFCTSLEHRHEYIQIVYVQKGRIKNVINDHIYDLCSGDILVIPPYKPHYLIANSEKPFELIEFEFTPSFIEPRLDSGMKPSDSDTLCWLEPFMIDDGTTVPTVPFVSLNGVIRYEIEETLNDVLKEYYVRKVGFQTIIKSLALKLLVQINREIGHSDINMKHEIIYEWHRDSLQRSIEFIHANFTHDITFKDAADVAIMSPSYYRRYFKLFTKKTFTEYLNSLRIARAAELLKANPQKKVLEICYEAGFNNVSHFNRTFLRITGVTPKAFRSGTTSYDKDDNI